MSAAIRLQAKLPGDPTTNGLDYLAPELVEKADTVSLLVVAIVDVSAVTHKVDEDADVPTIRIRKMEALGVLGNVPLRGVGVVSQEHQEMFQRRAETRQGMKPLPFEALEKADDFEVTP